MRGKKKKKILARFDSTFNIGFFSFGWKHENLHNVRNVLLRNKGRCCFATWDTRLPRNRFNFKNARYSTYLILPGPGYAGYFETFFKLFRKRTEGNVGYDDTDSVRASFMKVLFQRSTRCPSVRQRC